MLPGGPFNEVNLGDWKPPCQGHFSVTLRWILLSVKRKTGNIRSLGLHKRPWFSVFLCFLLDLNTTWRNTPAHNNADCSWDTLEIIYAPEVLSHWLNHIQTELHVILLAQTACTEKTWTKALEKNTICDCPGKVFKPNVNHLQLAFHYVTRLATLEVKQVFFTKTKYSGQETSSYVYTEMIPMESESILFQCE